MCNPYACALSQEMLGYVQLLEYAGKSVGGYKTTFRSLDAYLTKNNIREKALDEQLVTAYLRTLTCKPQTKNLRIGHLRQFARYLVALEIPAYEPEYVRASSDFVAYTFTDEEFAAIVKAADNFVTIKHDDSSAPYMFPVLLRILYGCGLRVGEALRLCWNDIEFDRHIIIIREAKNYKQRLVPMQRSLTDVLRLYRRRQLADSPNSELLFESDRKHGEPYLSCTFRDWFLKLLEHVGIAIYRKAPSDRSISPHTVRHYFTIKSFLKSEEEGRSLEETAPYLSAILGHESFFGTEKYLTNDYTVYESSQKRMNESIGGLFPEVVFE